MQRQVEALKAAAFEALRPPPRLDLSDWIEANIVLPDGVSALSGGVRLWPFQREIADAIGDPGVERVTLVKPVRVGFTTLLTGALASYTVNDPAPILALLPTESDARDYMVSDLEPIFAASPALAGVLARDTDTEAGRNTLLHRMFAGGSLKLVASKAPRNLRRHNARVLLIDEADAMEAGVEGNPIRLGERRTLSFADRKIVVGSTPIFEDTSHVLRSYAQSDARVFEVPCPACGAFTEIQWRHIEWPEDRPDLAFFRCPHCDEMIAERHKPAMVERGQWRATRADVAGHAGFRLNALVSGLANASWGKLAQEFLTAQDDPTELQTFVNTILAQGWRAEGEQLDDAELEARAEPIGLNVAHRGETLGLPEEVICLTAGVDVQADRLEVTFLGHDDGGTALALGHDVLFGPYGEDGVWQELDDLLRTRWTHPLGGKLGVDACLIDASDGHAMTYVYAFANPRNGRKVYASKGMAGFQRAPIELKKQREGYARFVLVGVDTLKQAMMTRLTKGRKIRFSRSLGSEWYEQLASEQVVVKYARGQPTRRFVRIPGRRAEALDCLIYAMAARHLVQVNADERRRRLAGESEVREAKRRGARMSKYSAALNR